MTADCAALLREAARLHQAGDLDAARQGYEAVLRQEPDQPDALHLLGVLCDQRGDHEHAIDLIGRAVALRPEQAEQHGNLATALLGAGKTDQAEASYRRAVAIEPRYVEGHYNLANLLRAKGDAMAAVAAFETALALQPNHAQARNNLAMLLWEDLGDSRAAERQFRLLLSLAPDWATGHMNYGLYRLAAGAYVEGWDEYEWRWRSDSYGERDWGQGLPRWTGEVLAGKGLLLWGEQGVGDQILYGTMLRDIARLSGARITVAVSSRLVALFRRSLSPHGMDVVARGEKVDAVAQCPFGSLGRWVRRTEADFANAGTYLQADAVRVGAVRDVYRAAGAGRRLVGLSWRSGNTTIGAEKSIPVTDLIPLLRAPGILWVNLQYGDCTDDLAAMRAAGVEIHTQGGVDSLRDMDGFAAQVAALDAVVSISNTTVHVAGALGVPTRLLLAAGRGRLWYWPDRDSGARWYDSVSLVRQSRPGDWSSACGILAAGIPGIFK